MDKKEMIQQKPADNSSQDAKNAEYLLQEKQIVRAIFQNIGQGSPGRETLVLKRALGRSFYDRSIQEKTALWEFLPDEKISRKLERAAFYVAVLICQDITFGYGKKYIKFQELLRRAYQNGSDTMKMDLERFLTRDIGEYGAFHHSFYRIARRVMREYMEPHETLDYASLMHDIRQWQELPGEASMAQHSWAAAMQKKYK